MKFWKDRLTKFGISYNEMTRFNETYIQFEDPHGLKLEFVEREGGEINNYSFGEVIPEVAIKGFGGAILLSTKSKETSAVLEEVMGLEFIGQEGDYTRYRSTADIANIIDLKTTSKARGYMGVGTVHHIAWRAIDQQDHLDWQAHVARSGHNVTPVKDRNYFDAIYFREPGEILFEIATDAPGFAHDESFETMGQNLKLPEQYEPYRSVLEKSLIPLEVRNLD
jgi:glyoxalase family protein